MGKKPRSEKKLSTYDKTLELIKMQLGLEEIVSSRGFTMSTAISHLQKIKDAFPETDIEYLRPESSMISRVQEAKTELTRADRRDAFDDKGNVKLTALKRKLPSSFSFDDIKLALVFIEDFKYKKS